MSTSVVSPEIIYHEKVRVSPSMWLLVPVFTSIGFLVLAPIQLWAGYVSGAVTGLVTVVILLSLTSEITVTADRLQVGRATIERHFVGSVTGYRGEEAFNQRGRKLHGLAYLNLRGWVKPVVRIQITDERDRTPYWLTSTRHPEELVAALGGAMHVDAEQFQDEDQPAWLKEIDQDGQ